VLKVFTQKTGLQADSFKARTAMYTSW